MDEKRRLERRQRHLQDDLRYALKKLPEPLDTSMSYEAVRSIALKAFITQANLNRLYHLSKIFLNFKLSKTTKVDERPSLNLLRDKRSEYCYCGVLPLPLMQLQDRLRELSEDGGS